MSLIDCYKDLKNLCLDMEEMYKCALNGVFRTEADSLLGKFCES